MTAEGQATDFVRWWHRRGCNSIVGKTPNCDCGREGRVTALSSETPVSSGGHHDPAVCLGKDLAPGQGHALRCPAYEAHPKRHEPPAVEVVEVVRGWRTYPDGSVSPVERWVRHADGDWVSLDSERRTSGDILMDLEADRG